MFQILAAPWSECWWDVYTQKMSCCNSDSLKFFMSPDLSSCRLFSTNHYYCYFAINLSITCKYWDYIWASQILTNCNKKWVRHLSLWLVQHGDGRSAVCDRFLLQGTKTSVLHNLIKSTDICVSTQLIHPNNIHWGKKLTATVKKINIDTKKLYLCKINQGNKTPYLNDALKDLISNFKRTGISPVDIDL